MKKLITPLITIILIQSCHLWGEAPDAPRICTEEFRTITVTITGGTLDDFYTIRKSTEETIRYSKEDGLTENYYPILDDSYQSKFANSQETFQFIGILNETIVVDEEYVIAADFCHINLVSGKTEIDL